MGFQYDAEAILRSVGQDPDEGTIISANAHYDVRGEESIVILLDCGIGGTKKWRIPVKDLDPMLKSEATKGDSGAETQDDTGSVESSPETDNDAESQDEVEQSDEGDSAEMTALLKLGIKELREMAKDVGIKLKYTTRSKRAIAELLIAFYDDEVEGRDLEADESDESEVPEVVVETEEEVESDTDESDVVEYEEEEAEPEDEDAE